MKQKQKRIYSIFFRYIILIFLAFKDLWIFYFIFTHLTIYPVLFLLNLFSNAYLSGNAIIFNNSSIKLVEACIAGAAYYLLTILNLTTPMNIKKRVLSLIFSFVSFLIINILRIFVFSILFSASFSLFSSIHLFFWYVLSSIIVFLIWLLEIKIFKIKEIPVYSDLKLIYSKIKKSKKLIHAS